MRLLLPVRLSVKIVAIDCSDVESLTEEQLSQLFSSIPDSWDFVELAEVFNTDTFSNTLAQQFSEYCDRRHGRVTLVVHQRSVG